MCLETKFDAIYNLVNTVGVRKIGGGVTVKSASNSDRQKAEDQSRREGREIKAEGTAHFSYSKSPN